MIEIWHNPRCSKSRQTVALVEAQGHKVRIVRYLKDTPSAADIKAVLAKLGISADDLLRKGESIYRELPLQNADEEQIVNAMAAHPILIERPIVINGNRARVGRPPEAVLEIL